MPPAGWTPPTRICTCSTHASGLTPTQEGLGVSLGWSLGRQRLSQNGLSARRGGKEAAGCSSPLRAAPLSARESGATTSGRRGHVAPRGPASIPSHPIPKTPKAGTPPDPHPASSHATPRLPPPRARPRPAAVGWGVPRRLACSPAAPHPRPWGARTAVKRVDPGEARQAAVAERLHARRRRWRGGVGGSVSSEARASSHNKGGRTRAAPGLQVAGETGSREERSRVPARAGEAGRG